MSTISRPTVSPGLALELDRTAPPARLSEEEFDVWRVGEDRRVEWVDGEVLIMSPSNLNHSRLSGLIDRLLGLYIQLNDLGELLGGEYMIRLGEQRRRRVPDLVHISKERSRRLGPTYFEGAPDLAVEIVSPETVARDYREKYLEYEAAGVREYWIVDPINGHLEVHALSAEGRYEPIPPTADGRVRSRVVPGFFVHPTWLSADEAPPLRTMLQELGLMDPPGRTV